jgi:Protein of unknown function (DUF3987)
MSARVRAPAVDIAMIPSELVPYRQWVVWKWGERDGKPTKLPHIPATGALASVTNPDQWDNFERTIAALNNGGGFDGIGFVLTSTDPFVGVDLDKCRAPETGAIEPWAREIVDDLKSYTEVTPSGAGLRIFVQGTLPPGGRRKNHLEIYDSARYLTVTGQHLAGTPRTIERREAELLALHRGIFGEPAVTTSIRAAEPVGLEDHEVLDRARHAANGDKFSQLWDGLLGPDADHSAADLALCNMLAFWTGRDAARMNNLFRLSGLMRPKWNERHGARTYGEMTIAKAIDSCAETYTPRPAVTNLSSPSSPAIASDAESGLKLADHAYHGLAGAIVQTIAPHSEADPVAILAHILVAVGNVIGRGAHFLVEQTPHALNEYVALVGATAKGRKGMAWSTPKAILRELDPEWVSKRVKTGLSSGEGVIYHVRDAREETQPIKEKGRIVGYETAVVDQGEADKRLLVIEPEFASVLRRMSSETNTLSAILRQAWDDGDLSTLTKNSPLRATGSHVSIVAHITREELITSLTETERANGFANRFLFLLVRRSQFLPEGGQVPREQLHPLIRDLQDSVTWAHANRRFVRDDAARQVWATVYPQLSAGEPGLLGAVLARGEAHVLRLSMLYAVLDRSPVIRDQHLFAALALWDYATASARRIFGDRLGLSTANVIETAAKRRGLGGISRTEISTLFQRNKSESEIDAALSVLEAGGRMTRSRQVPEGGKGRPIEVWVCR